CGLTRHAPDYVPAGVQRLTRSSTGLRMRPAFTGSIFMIDHTGLTVGNFARSKAFYTRALAPIGYELIMELPDSITGHGDVAGFGAPPKPDFWIGSGKPNVPPIHVAFRVANRSLGAAFHTGACAAGGRDNGAPGLRPHYHPDYYGAFVLDPDGHNIEAVCHDAP